MTALFDCYHTVQGYPQMITPRLRLNYIIWQILELMCAGQGSRNLRKNVKITTIVFEVSFFMGNRVHILECTVNSVHILECTVNSVQCTYTWMYCEKCTYTWMYCEQYTYTWMYCEQCTYTWMYCEQCTFTWMYCEQCTRP